MTVTPNMLGSYGNYFANEVLTEGPLKKSFRNNSFTSAESWQKQMREMLSECLAPVIINEVPKATVVDSYEWDQLSVEILQWQLPFGPTTEAVFMKPAKSQGKLPGVLALHDHAGNKFLGYRKITKLKEGNYPIQKTHQEQYYEGRAWVNELAKKGFAVLAFDTFSFGSRRVLAHEMPETLRKEHREPDPFDEQAIQEYLPFALQHEAIIMKSLLSAGTTLPGVYVKEDQTALSILAARSDVDPKRLACAGLSGGGLRTVLLSGFDTRIKCAAPSGFMTTWRDLLLQKSFMHTWMAYIPHLPQELDFPEILALGQPAHTFVLNCTDDKLFSLEEMQRADNICQELFKKLNHSEKYQCQFYPGGHRLDIKMQNDLFQWLQKHL